MIFKLFRSMAALLLAAGVLLSGLPFTGFAETVPSDPVETTAATEETQQEETYPEETKPQETQPEETNPAETQPEVTEPEETQPEVTEPEETNPAETQPVVTEPEETQPEQTQPEVTEPQETQSQEAPEPPPEEPPVLLMQAPPSHRGPGLFFGQLHAHSNLSEGTQSVQELFAAAKAEGMDFFAVTDHSDSLDHRDLVRIDADAVPISSDWAEGKAAAADVTDFSFVGIYGYEMSWPRMMQIGHMATFATPGFQSWDQEAFEKYDHALTNYYDALASVPASISQFNHPGTDFGSFDDFGHYSETTDRLVSLIEVDCSDAESLQYYIKALDLGWHLAPTGGTEAMTVIRAENLTEADLFDAIRKCRAYATEDPDLEIIYTMNGHPMGERLKRRHIGDELELSLSLQDPTDGTDSTVEVITNGGLILGRDRVVNMDGTLSFYLPVSAGYYFLRITQPDGDVALTAPIWVETEERLGISALSCETSVPVQNQPVQFRLDLYNGETVPFLVSGLEILADGVPVAQQQDLTEIPVNTNLEHTISLSCDCVGLTQIAVRLSGTLEGSPRTYEATLLVNFRRAEQVTTILVDGSHGNAGLDRLLEFNRMAMDEHIRLSIADAGLPGGELEKCRFLLVTAPSQPFSGDFLEKTAEFAGYGGSILICGQADHEDMGFHSAAELNRLLSAIGATMRFEDDLVRDTVNNSGDPSVFYADDIALSSPWCKGVSENQVYRVVRSCSVAPGKGTALISGRSTTDSIDGDSDGLGGSAAGNVTLLACEALSGGGTVLAAGGLFLADENMEESKNIWDEPWANRTIARNLFGIGGDVLPLSTIAQARAAAPGTLLRVRGYATTGTSNPYNTFPETVYLQDETGGIAVTPFPGENIQQGTPLEIVGYAGTQNGNRTLKTGSWKVLDGFLYQYQPLEGEWGALLDVSENGGRFLQVEGVCYAAQCREDDTLAGCLLLDDRGRTVKVKVEDYIFNGSDGINPLHNTVRRTRTIRAAGLLHLDEYGEPVIRVRNCEEVVWVPPRHYWNPKTADPLPDIAMAAMLFSAMGLGLLIKRRP